MALKSAIFKKINLFTYRRFTKECHKYSLPEKLCRTRKMRLTEHLSFTANYKIPS